MTKLLPPLTDALELVQVSPGRSTARLHRSWWSWSGPHGGLLGALALRAAQAVVAADRAPQVLSVQFLDTAPDGPLDLDAVVLRSGGSSDVVRVDLSAAAGPVATATVTLARLRPGGTTYEDVPAPQAPAPWDCPDVGPPADVVPFAQQLLIRGVTGELVSGGDRAELAAWVRWRDERVPLDAAALVVLTDALPPALYGIATVPVPVPTVDLGVVLTGAVPRGLDVLVRIRTRRAADGWCVDDCDLWDGSGADGRVLAQSRQARRVLGEVRP